MVYSNKNYWDFGLYSSSTIPKKLEKYKLDFIILDRGQSQKSQ
jgi:hypothetical protein